MLSRFQWPTVSRIVARPYFKKKLALYSMWYRPSHLAPCSLLGCKSRDGGAEAFEALAC